jgi:histidinol dehydrogenase
MLASIYLATSAGHDAYEQLMRSLRLDPRGRLLNESTITEQVRAIMVDVARRGDEALVESTRRFDDPSFEASRLRILPDELAAAHARMDLRTRDAMKRAIAQVREYQSHIMPSAVVPLARPGVQLGLRHTPIDRVGLYVPGGKASYPSSLIMLAVPAQVAGVRKIVVCTPAGRHGQNDLLLAAAHELGIEFLFRAGGAGAISAMALGTSSVPAVDKICGPGNTYVQLAKAMLTGTVGIDGYYGPSEIVVLADDSCNPRFVAADLIAQAEHDPGRCFLVTTSDKVVASVNREIESMLGTLGRSEAIVKSLREQSAAIVTASMSQAIEVANDLAGEHVSLQVGDVPTALRLLRHAGAIFVGPHSPVAAGDYVAGPSHSLPTNTTARFSGGCSVYEFLKRTSLIRYEAAGLHADAGAIEAMAACEGLDAHANSVRVRH